MKAMIFAAGLGTRLKPFTDNAPKALAKVAEKSLLERNIRYLQRHNIYDVIVNVHHFADMISNLLASEKGFGSNITISDERETVLETGGGLKKASWFFTGEEAFVVMNVDILTNLDLSKMIAGHMENQPVATLAVSDRNSSRQLLFDEQMSLCGWRNNGSGEEKISRAVQPMLPFSFSGVQVLSNHIWEGAPFDGKFSLIDLYLHTAKTQTVQGYNHSGDLFIDVGKPESIAKAEQMFPGF